MANDFQKEIFFLSLQRWLTMNLQGSLNFPCTNMCVNLFKQYGNVENSDHSLMVSLV